MSILTASNLSKSFGDDEIFSDVTVEIPQGARIALVGPNGAGKTTLLHLLIGEETPSEGSINTAKNITIGFLPQHPEMLSENTLWDEALSAFDELRDREQELQEIEQQMAAGDDSALERYGELQERFELDGGYTYLQRTKTVLKGLGFDEDDFNTKLGQLSGGQKTRALLARLLLEAPGLLALDEPTNHLDIAAVEWLEGYLKDYPGAVLAISHDRYFIDTFAKIIWDMDYGMLETYRANYTQYIQQREERRALQLKEFEAQQAFIAKEEEYIRRNIEGQNTRQAQGRRKRLNRLKRDSLIDAPGSEHHKMRLQLDITHRGNEYVLTTDALQVGYPDDDAPLLNAQNIRLERGEIAALIGPNGVGKSTFIKTVTGQLQPLAGDVEIGDLVEIGYFAQAHELLDPNKEIIDAIIETRHMTPGEARGYLAKYLFRGDDVFRKIGSLSAGERGRVALAKLALGTANLLLLDEPTNHLDIPAQEVLEAMLTDYGGTVLLVSHDRYLIDALATQIWVALPPEKGSETGKVDVFKGSYSEYVEERERNRAAAASAARSNGANGKKQSNAPAEKSNKSKHGLNPFQLKQRVAQVEAEIERLETQLSTLTEEIGTASANGNADAVQKLGEAYTQTEHDLEAIMVEWETLMSD